MKEEESNKEEREIIHINTTIFSDGKNFEKIKVGDSEVITFSVQGSFTLPYKTFPTKVKNEVLDYEESYAYSLKQIEEEFKKFPNCCEYHQKLPGEKWFNLKDFKEASKLCTDKIFYSYNHILNHIKDEDEGWELEIKDYLDYTVESFGSFPQGFGAPLHINHYLSHIRNILSIMEESEEYSIYPAKIKILRDYIEHIINPKETATGSEIDLLLKTYDKWYHIFPFEISYLQSLKKEFSKSFPIIKSAHTNKYSGRTFYKLITKEDLINHLLKTTNKIITEFNTLNLYKEKQISNYSQLQLELILKEREIQINQGYLTTYQDETDQYYQILKKWLRDEVHFINTITSLFDDESENKKEFQSFDQEIVQLKTKENLFWKGIPMEVVIDHFIKLTTYKNKKKEPYLTQSQFISFIKRSFLQQDQESKQTLNISNSENGAVIKLFYEFFDLAVGAYGEKSKNEKYIKLVTENLTNWESTSRVKSLFRKDKSSKNW